MTSKICDLCGKEITKIETSHEKLVFADSVLGAYAFLDLHNACSTRLRNKINEFIAEAKQNEAIRKAGEAACGGANDA